MDERRASIRLRHLKRARVIFNGRNSTMTCLIRNLSAGGARLSLDQPFALSPEFELEFDGTVRPARRVWLAKGECGIAFAG